MIAVLMTELTVDDEKLLTFLVDKILNDRPSGVARALIGGGGGGAYSYIRVLPDGFLLKLSSFQKKSVGQNTNI